MSVIWSDQEIAILEALRSACSTREIHKVFELLDHERSMEAISKKSRNMGIGFKDYGAPSMMGLSPEESKAIQQILDQREHLIQQIEPPVSLSPAQKSQMTSAKRNLVADLMDELLEIRNMTPRTGSVSLKTAKGKKESLCLLLSDFHVGRIVLGPNQEEQYNIKTALSRIRSIPERVVDCLGSKDLADFDELVIILAGDHVDGEGIFPAQEMSLETHVAEQVIGTSKAIWQMIIDLRQVFPLVRIATVRGNHGRSSKFHSAEANWDNMVFQQIELLVDMHEDPNITIKNRYSSYNIVEVKGWRGLIRHFAPVQADTAAASNKFAGWNGIHNWDFVCYGHFHHWGVMTWNSKPIFRNGSVMGPDDYSENLAVHDEPTQLMFGISSKSLPTFIKPIKFD